MKPGMRIFLLFCLVVLGISLGALREFIFINLNYWIDHLARLTEFCYAHSFFNFLEGSSLVNLKTTKWAMAVFFIVLMFSFTSAFLKLLFRDRPVLKWAILSFGTTILISLIFFGLHAFLGPEQVMLSIAVKALHAVQYPFLLFFLVPAISLLNTTDKA